MCIRDRGRRGDDQRIRRLSVGVPVQHVEPRARRVQRRHRCLLYTSDAADERSSVDLGGRRIIKKKKKTK